MRAALLALLSTVVASAAPLGVLVRLGLTDTEPTVWNGSVAVDGGTILGVEPHLFGNEDSLQPDGSFALRTDPRPGRPPVVPNGLLVTVDAGATAALRVSANGATWSVPLAALRWGEPLAGLDGAAEAERAPVYRTLQESAREDDHPAACTLADGTVIAVWQSWSEVDGDDQLFLARRRDGAWSAAEPVPGVRGDLWRAAVAPDGGDAFRLVWSQFADGDYDLWQARWAGGAWSPPARLAEREGHDVDVALATAADGAIHAVWRGQGETSSDILHAVCRDGTWSAPEPLDGSPGNEWQPAIAAGPGGVWAAWDSYEYGSYDLFAMRLDEQPRRRIAIAASPRFEAKASVACAPDGTVWFAWQEAGADWGKDTGLTVPEAQRRQGIYRERSARVACLRNGQWFDAPAPETAFAEGERALIEAPRIAVDSAGGVWLAVRRPLQVPRQQGDRTRQERVWENYLTHLAGDRWAPARRLANRLGRQDDQAVLSPAGDGLAVLFHTDGRGRPDLRVMQAHRIFATSFEAEPAVEPALTPRPEQVPAAVHQAEAAQLRLCRSAMLESADGPLSLVRGDTHRHTEVSWDGTGDGGLLDAYRYARDAAGLDFFVVTDHNQRSGVDLPYIRWWNYKVAEVMHHPGVFVTFFGYERSLGYPNGHRNIIQTTREHPSFRFTGAADDLQQLYAYAHQTQSIIIAHTTGTNHGTDWYAFDREVEPVIEIFQGCRLSYEYEGAPKSGRPGDAQAQNTGYQPKGFLWRAWERDLRLGITSSSDHGSTHYSYSGVWTRERSRQAIHDALRARHTFGATDNFIVKLRASGRVMGDEWPQREAPRLEIDIQAPGELTQVDIIRDMQFVYTTDPDGTRYAVTWQDEQWTPGAHFYYIRAIQADGSLAWGSPVWIEEG